MNSLSLPLVQKGPVRSGKLGEETGILLSKMKEQCRHCGAKAHFLWLTSNGLLENNAETIFAKGISETLLRRGKNSPPYSVCGLCCVDLICKSIEIQNLTFLEVCGPRSEDGFVLPMGYCEDWLKAEKVLRDGAVLQVGRAKAAQAGRSSK